MPRSAQYIFDVSKLDSRANLLYYLVRRQAFADARSQLIVTHHHLDAAVPKLRGYWFRPAQLGFDSIHECRKAIDAGSDEVRLTNHIDEEKGLVWQIPFIEKNSYVDAAADLLGGIYVRSGCFIAPNSAVRMDEKNSLQPLVIGSCTNLQDHSTIHAHPKRIGSNCIIAHDAVAHGCDIGDNVTIYIKSVVDTGAVVGNNVFVDACAYVGRGVVVPDGRYVPPETAVTSSEAAQKLPVVGDEQRRMHRSVLDSNASLARHYLEGQRRNVEELMARIATLSQAVDDRQ